MAGLMEVIEMNVDLLIRVRYKILDEPRQFVMQRFFATSMRIDSDSETPEGLRDISREVPNCGTAACIAGWALTLSRTESHRPIDAAEYYMYRTHLPARVELGLTSLQAQRLFYVTGWPWEFQKRWEETRDVVERARIAADRIDHFIATGGEE